MCRCYLLCSFQNAHMRMACICVTDELMIDLFRLLLSSDKQRRSTRGLINIIGSSTTGRNSSSNKEAGKGHVHSKKPPEAPAIVSKTATGKRTTTGSKATEGKKTPAADHPTKGPSIALDTAATKVAGKLKAQEVPIHGQVKVGVGGTCQHNSSGASAIATVGTSRRSFSMVPKPIIGLPSNVHPPDVAASIGAERLLPRSVRVVERNLRHASDGNASEAHPVVVAFFCDA